MRWFWVTVLLLLGSLPNMIARQSAGNADHEKTVQVFPATPPDAVLGGSCIDPGGICY